MSIPASINATCDVYRAGSAPPDAPAVSQVPCRLEASYWLGLESGEGDALAKRFTHTMLVDFRVDIRDDYAAGTVGASADTVYVPDQTGTAFKVVFVEHHLVERQQTYKKVFLARKSVTWPSTEL